MKLKPIPKAEKEKQMNKMLSYIRSKVKDYDETNLYTTDELYYACETAGHMLYEFLKDYIE